MRNEDRPGIEDAFSDWFWDVIARAHSSNERLREILEAMSKEDMVQFYREFCLAAAELRGDPYAEFQRGLSEDSVEDIAEQIVSAGKEAYAAAVAHPESFPRSRGANPTAYKSVVLRTYRERFGELLPH